jgi:hypothetical protein
MLFEERASRCANRDVTSNYPSCSSVLIVTWSVEASTSSLGAHGGSLTRWNPEELLIGLSCGAAPGRKSLKVYYPFLGCLLTLIQIRRVSLFTNTTDRERTVSSCVCGWVTVVWEKLLAI